MQSLQFLNTYDIDFGHKAQFIMFFGGKLSFVSDDDRFDSPHGSRDSM